MKRVLVAIVVAGGCQTGGEPVPLEDLAPAVSSVYCARAFECFSAEERGELFGGVELADEQACIAYFTRAYFDALVEITAAVHEGQVTYDGHAATGCLSDIAGASCAELRIGFDYAARGCEAAFECVACSQ
jgi:hypothetical protein